MANAASDHADDQSESRPRRFGTLCPAMKETPPALEAIDIRHRRGEQTVVDGISLRLEKGRIHVAAVCVGVAQRILEEMAQALAEREGL
ncbi:MAG: hypothetical protein DSZ24_07575 [Thermodesulfatator sp.]|nr:MAG: hypothetical protein DSZ24_07575 [Thermodesulfatator sp.]